MNKRWLTHTKDYKSIWYAVSLCLHKSSQHFDGASIS